MELETLRKRLDTYRTSAGKLTKVPDDLALEVLLAWEQWAGPARGFYSAIGVDYRKMAKIMGRAKGLKREGRVPVAEFSELTSQVLGPQVPAHFNGQGIELSWDQGRVIRFQEVTTLIDFLKKVA
jgi:hypothetical protein